MLGWMKLMETIRKSDPPSNASTRLLPNSNLRKTLFKQKSSFSNATHTNGHILTSSETINTPVPSKSPQNIFDCPLITNNSSTPGQNAGDPPPINIAPVPTRSSERELQMQITPTTASSSSPSSTSIYLLAFVKIEYKFHSKFRLKKISETFKKDYYS